MNPEEAEGIGLQFEKDCAQHEMIIQHDQDSPDGDSAFRHVTFKRPGSMVYRFDLVTWPGYLAVSGDMGSFMFSRIPDMFEFFRPIEGKPVGINPGYWGEKCTAGEMKEWSSDVFVKSVWKHFDCYEEDEEDEDAVRLVRSEIQSELRDFDNAWEATEWLNNFRVCFAGHRQSFHQWESRRWRARAQDFYFQDWFDWVRTEDYCYHYIWILYAISYGVRAYDKYTANPAYESRRKGCLLNG